jgi:hypothetical protein
LFKTKPRLKDGRSNLFHLVRLRVRARSLQIDLLLNAALPENVMAAPDALLETQPLQQSAQIVKPDGGIGGAAENTFECFLEVP